MKTANRHAPHYIFAALSILFFTSALAPAAALAAETFEGRIDMSITTPSGRDAGTNNMHYYIKPDKMRIDVDVVEKKKSEETTMTITSILDLQKQEMYVLIPGQKMYMLYAMKEQKPAKFKDAEIDFKPTGRKDVILGYEVEEYANTAKSDYTEMWLTKGLGKFVMGSKNAGPGKSQKQSGWEKYAADNDLFALRVVQYKKKGGAETLRIDVTDIKKSAQADSLFEIPEGYQKFSVGSMLKGLF